MTAGVIEKGDDGELSPLAAMVGDGVFGGGVAGEALASEYVTAAAPRTVTAVAASVARRIQVWPEVVDVISRLLVLLRTMTPRNGERFQRPLGGETSEAAESCDRLADSPADSGEGRALREAL